MSLHTNHLRARQINRPKLLPWVGWLLVLCINMAGPFPYFHCHGSENSAELARHILLHHGGDCAHANLGWHYHSELPQNHDEPSAPRQERPSPIQEPSAEITIRLLTDSVVPFDSATYPPLVWNIDRLASTSPVHFFDGFASSLALPVRLGVMRV